AEHYDEYRQLMEPKGWTLREAWDVSATPEAYRTYVQQSRGEFSCAKPAYVALQTAWVSDRTLCYLASGKPAVVQHTGPSRWLPNGEGLFRFRNMDDAVGALAAVEADYDRHCRAARALRRRRLARVRGPGRRDAGGPPHAGARGGDGGSRGRAPHPRRPPPGATGRAPLRGQPRHGVLHRERPRRHRGARGARRRGD